MRRLRLVLALLCAAGAFSPISAVTLKSERLYHESMTAMTRGDYQKAMEGFMDVLLEDPIYPEARDRLAESAKMILSREAESVDRERKQILAGLTYKSTQRRSFYRNDVAVRTWRSLMTKAERLAADPERLSSALEGYLKALGHFQIYHDSKPEFLEAKTRFQTALQKAFPHLVRDPVWKGRKAGLFNTGEFAEAVYLEERQGKSWAKDKQGLMYFSDREENDVHAQTAASVRLLENKILSSLSVAIQAHYRFNKEQLQDSLILWKKLSALDPENEEAAFFLDHIAGELKAAGERTPSSIAEIEEEPSQPAPVARRAPAPRSRARRVQNIARIALPPAPVEHNAPVELSAPKAPVLEPAAEVALAQEHYLKGLRAYSLGDLKSAISHWRACLELNPEHPKTKKALERAVMEDK